jgi:hypothetical protein
MIDMELVEQLSLWVAVLMAIGGLIGFIALISGNVLKLLNLGGSDGAEKLLAKDTLSRAEKSQVLRALKNRKLIIVVLTVIIILAACLGFLIYKKLVLPRQAIPPGFGFDTAEPIHPTKDKWLESNGLFQAVVTELMPESNGTDDAKADDAAADTRIADSKVIRMTTPAFGSATSGSPIERTACTVQYPSHDYSFRPPHVLVVRHADGRQSFEPLSVKSTDGTFSFTIPDAGADDHLLVVGALDRKSGGEIPEDLLSLFSFKVTK